MYAGGPRFNSGCVHLEVGLFFNILHAIDLTPKLQVGVTLLRTVLDLLGTHLVMHIASTITYTQSTHDIPVLVLASSDAEGTIHSRKFVARPSHYQVCFYS